MKPIQERINEAIDGGVLRLLRLQHADGSWSQHEAQYQGGMTGLALYTLLKSGVPPSHPAVASGIERLITWDPPATYSLACEMLALEASGDERHHGRMAMLTERLLDWQRYGWGYPHNHGSDGWTDRISRNDLSNMQFAAMALRAARHAGIAVPDKAFLDLIRETGYHQAQPATSVIPDAQGNPVETAGFGYVGPSAVGGRSASTGSMTCAGTAILAICRDMLGSRIRPKLATQLDESIQHALAWLDRRWTVTENPNQPKSWKNYYLYGLERVGSLLERQHIGAHDWYLEGAKELLAIQKDDGGFGDDPETCFALLFLLRATGQATGTPPIASVLGRYAVDDPASPVRFCAEGHSPLQLWVTAFGADGSPAARRATVERVEYVVDDEVVATVRGPEAGPPADPTFPVTLHLPAAGAYEIRVRVHRRRDGEVLPVLESLPLVVNVEFVWPPWAVHEAGWAARNLLHGPIQVTVSSENADWQSGARAVDGRRDGTWLCKPEDETPTIALRWRKAVKANTIVLCPPADQEVQRGRFDGATRIEVTVNGKGPAHVLAADPDPRRPTALRLNAPVRIKRLEVLLAERRPGSAWPGQAGFREVSLEIDPVAPPTVERDGNGLTTLRCAAQEARILYTLDGTLPTASSPVYDVPFARPEATRLHAIARLPSGETSRLLVADLPLADGYRRLDRRRWRIVKVDSEQLRGHGAAQALDGNPLTHWHTRHAPASDPLPHELVLDLGETVDVHGFTYRARHEGTHGMVKDWSFYVSDDPSVWAAPAGTGAFGNARGSQRGLLDGPVRGRYVRFVARTEVNGQPFTSCAELDVLAR